MLIMGQALAPPAPAATAHPDDKQAQQRRRVQDGADSMSTLVKEAGGLMLVGVECVATLGAIQCLTRLHTHLQAK